MRIPTSWDKKLKKKIFFIFKKMIFSKRSLIVTGIIFGSSLVYYLYKRNIEESDEVFRNGRIKLYKHIELVF